MKDPFANELRHLKPYLRRNMHLGNIKYRDQEKPVQMETEHERRLMAAGQRLGFGGQRHLPEENRVDVMTRDRLGRMPHIASTRDDVEVDESDAA